MEVEQIGGGAVQKGEEGRHVYKCISTLIKRERDTQRGGSGGKKKRVGIETRRTRGVFRDQGRSQTERAKKGEAKPTVSGTAPVAEVGKMPMTAMQSPNTAPTHDGRHGTIHSEIGKAHV